MAPRIPLKLKLKNRLYLQIVNCLLKRIPKRVQGLDVEETLFVQNRLVVHVCQLHVLLQRVFIVMVDKEIGGVGGNYHSV